MASFSRSFKPASYLSSVGRRPGMPARSLSNLSNTSEVNSAASSPGEVNADDILFSAMPSPTCEGSPFPSQTKKMNESHLKPLETPRSIRSRPIAIELPVTKRPNPANSQSVFTPPAPLSARGDIPGGYFPNHEDQQRVYRSHPFHLDISEARRKSIQRSSVLDSSDTPGLTTSSTEADAAVESAVESAAETPATAPLPLPSLRLPTAMPRRDLDSSQPTSRTSTPVSSYMPSGAHASPLPIGKYYPSNYESRKAQKRQNQQSVRPTTVSSVPGFAKSENHVPTLRGDSSMGHSRNESEAKRRLQQYQRDMIAQATLALSGGNVNTAALNAISLRNMGFSSLSTKPTKPRLEPLGSPGPVTPIDLAEGEIDGYLGVRAARSHEAKQVDEIARAILADEDRRRREGAGSPTVELGPAF